MHTEMSLLQRCCFCFPLRRGLLAWGYLKLTIASLMLCFLLWTVMEIIASVTIINDDGQVYTIDYFIFLAVILFIVIADVILQIVFVVGGHKKDVKLLKLYYIYSVIQLVLTVLTGTLCTGIIIGLKLDHPYQHITSSLFTNLCTVFIISSIQVYTVLLVKSEIKKLKNMDSFKIPNNAAEAERYKIKVESLYKEKEADPC